MMSSAGKITVGINDLEKRNEEAIFDALNAFDKKCPYCGKDQFRVGIRDKIEVDHFVPISKGGQNLPWNLVPICKNCNRRKKDRLPKDFLDEAVFERINTYLLKVKDQYQTEGIESYLNISNLTNLIEEHSIFIKENSSHDFIKKLVHLACIDKASELLTQESSITETIKISDMPGLVEQIKNRQGIFVNGVIGSPFHKICNQLSIFYGGNISNKILLEVLKYSGWIDRGRIASRQRDTKKHILCAPELAHLPSSKLRNMIEDTPK